MAFEIRNFDKLSLSVTVNAPLEFTYNTTTDDLATILTDGYFDQVKGSLKVNDFIKLTSLSDRLFTLRVFSVSPTVVTAEVSPTALRTKVTAISSSALNLNYLGVAGAAGPTTQTIASEDIARDGYVLTIKDEDASASTKNITIATEGSETIDGNATALINVDLNFVNMIARGGNLHII